MTQEYVFDVAIVFGTGIKPDGTLADSSVACVEKAVDLLKSKLVPQLLFSGKYAWNLTYIPPVTEARAMANLALNLGCNSDQIEIGEEGQTTVHNLCWIKQRFLKPHNYSPIFIIPSDIFLKRQEYNIKMVLGPKFKYKIVSADYLYPLEIEQSIKSKEKVKLKDCVAFYKNITPGDDQTIMELSQKDLQENYLTKL